MVLWRLGYVSVEPWNISICVSHLCLTLVLWRYRDYSTYPLNAVGRSHNFKYNETNFPRGSLIKAELCSYGISSVLQRESVEGNDVIQGHAVLLESMHHSSNTNFPTCSSELIGHMQPRLASLPRTCLGAPVHPPGSRTLPSSGVSAPLHAWHMHWNSSSPKSVSVPLV